MGPPIVTGSPHGKAHSGGPYGRFGRAVDVPKRRTTCCQLVRQILRQRFATGQKGQALNRLKPCFQQHAPQCRCGLHVADITLLDPRDQPEAVKNIIMRCNHCAPTADQGHKQFKNRDVEHDRCHGKQAALGVKVRVPCHGFQKVDDGSMTDLYPFWCAGRTGCKHDISCSVAVRFDRFRRSRCGHRFK